MLKLQAYNRWLLWQAFEKSIVFISFQVSLTILIHSLAWIEWTLFEIWPIKWQIWKLAHFTCKIHNVFPFVNRFSHAIASYIQEKKIVSPEKYLEYLNLNFSTIFHESMWFYQWFNFLIYSLIGFQYESAIS